MQLEAETIDLADMAHQAKKAADLLKAMSHETRLLLLCALVNGERAVSELEEMLRLPQSTVSQQLARLRHDRLVQTRRDGRMIYYSIADKDVAQIIATLHSIFCRELR
ncbi:MAG: metalloregulator ArsR/SmtB family transcription factor [Pseudomonadota bacterium]